MDCFKIISDSELAAGMTPEEIGKIAEITTMMEFRSGNYIIRESDTSCDIFLIFEGWVSVEIHRFPYDSISEPLRLLKSECVVGEFSFIDKSRRSANVIAQDNVRSVMLPCQQLEDLLGREHLIGYHLMRNLARLLAVRIRNTNFELRNQLIW